MRSTIVFPLIPLFCCCLWAGCQVDGTRMADPQIPDLPVQAEYLGSRDLKPPMKSYSIRLMLVNRQDKPIWFVLPSWGDKPLPENGVFNNSRYDQPFGGEQFEGEGGSAIKVEMFGGDGFNAFHLPANGRLELDGYSIDGSKDIKEIIVLETKELKINGKTSLEQWLPYGTICSQNVKVSQNQLSSGWKNLDWNWEKNRERDDYPKEKVEEVKAETIRSWTVKFQRK